MTVEAATESSPGDSAANLRDRQTMFAAVECVGVEVVNVRLLVASVDSLDRFAGSEAGCVGARIWSAASPVCSAGPLTARVSVVDRAVDSLIASVASPVAFAPISVVSAPSPTGSVSHSVASVPSPVASVRSSPRSVAPSIRAVAPRVGAVIPVVLFVGPSMRPATPPVASARSCDATVGACDAFAETTGRIVLSDLTPVFWHTRCFLAHRPAAGREARRSSLVHRAERRPTTAWLKGEGSVV